MTFLLVIGTACIAVFGLVGVKLPFSDIAVPSRARHGKPDGDPHRCHPGARQIQSHQVKQDVSVLISRRWGRDRSGNNDVCTPNPRESP